MGAKEDFFHLKKNKKKNSYEASLTFNFKVAFIDTPVICGTTLHPHLYTFTYS